MTEEQRPSISSSNDHSDSEISYSMCRVSVGSHSQSLDSVSVNAFEVTRFSKHVKKKNKHNNKFVCKLPSSQKGSVTSQELNQQVWYNILLKTCY